AVSKYLAAIGIDATVHQGNSLGDWAGQIGSNDLIQGPFGIDIMSQYYGIFFKGLNDPVINKLYVQGRRALHPTPYWQKIPDQVTGQAYSLPLIFLDRIYFVDSKVSNVVVGKRARIIPTEWKPK